MALILKVVEPYKYYIVCIDASKEGLGGVLSQEWHVVCYESCNEGSLMELCSA